MIGGKLDDAVAETDAARALAGRPEEDFRRGGVRVLLEEVVLDLPRVVVAEPVGQLDLGQRVLEQAVLAVRAPGARELVLVDDAELHGATLTGQYCTASAWSLTTPPSGATLATTMMKRA